jgi:hypothetical protein
MSKATAAITRAKFAVKTAPAPVVVAPTVDPEFRKAVRNDGVEGHNLEWMELDGYLYMRIALAGPTTPAKSGKPLLSTSRGFIMIGSKQNISLSLNALQR